MKKVLIYVIGLMIMVSMLSACTSTVPESNNDKSQVQASQSGIQSSKDNSQTNESSNGTSSTGKAQVFTNLNGKLGGGIICDNSGNMFVSREGGLDIITPDGKTFTFCSFSGSPRGNDYNFRSPFIWGMVFDKEGNILAASQDRIIKISMDGKASTLVWDNYDGFAGASGIECDKEGNIYVTSGNKILKYDSRLKKSTFIDERKEDSVSFFSIKFDSDYKNLYAVDINSYKVFKYPVDANMIPGDPVVVLDADRDNIQLRPVNLLLGEKGNIYVCNESASKLTKIDSTGRIESIDLGGELSTQYIAFGKKGFDEESIYCTVDNGDNIYKFSVGEKEAKR